MVSTVPSRKRVHDANAARAAILNAAEAVFAEQGFAGARVDTIAAQAGYNKSLLFQYFGDKLQLYAAVLKRADQEANELRARVFAPLLENPQLASTARELRAFFERAFHALFDYLVDHPRLLRILLWEMADGWQTYAQIAPQMQGAEAHQIDLLFEAGQRAGFIRSPFVPAIQLAMALQICQAYLASLPLFQLLRPAEDLSAAAALAQARTYIVGLLVAGIMVDPLEPGEPQENSAL